MPVLFFCFFYVAVTSTPSDGESGRPDEDTFGVSSFLNDVDETDAEHVAPGLCKELLCVSTQSFTCQSPL